VSAESFRRELEDAGFGLFAALEPETYDAFAPPAWHSAAVAPGCRSVIVVGNAGKDVWRRLHASQLPLDPRNPVDTYTRQTFEAALHAHAPDSVLALYDSKRDGVYPPMVTCAEHAGLGVPSRLGLLLHPEFGPWMSLRALVFLNERVPAGRPLDVAPCDGCPAPCRAACPADAIDETLALPPCLRSRLWRCRSTCDARSACVIGPAHAFPPEQLAHHMKLRPSLPWLRRALPILASELVQRGDVSRGTASR
jgi:hypothetical protein